VNLEALEKILAALPGYRRVQARRALYRDLVPSWLEATALPLELRRELEEAVPLPASAEFFPEADGSAERALVVLGDGEAVETVLMRHGSGRRTVCVSSQAGCALGCSFCATAERGWSRNLSAGEIVGQVRLVARRLAPAGEKVGNVVFMGMGEPLLNYEAVAEAVRELNAADGFNIAARRISISTAGIVPGIQRLAAFPLQVNLAVSLHAPDDRRRKELMPLAGKVPLRRLLAAVRDYQARTNRRVMFEYILIDGFNDNTADARALGGLLRKDGPRLFLVNLIPCNPARGFRAPPEARIEGFRRALEGEGVSVTRRYRFGRGVRGACGQLAGRDEIEEVEDGNVHDRESMPGAAPPGGRSG